MSAVVLNSTITCPACGRMKDETMPTDRVRMVYEWSIAQPSLRRRPETAVCTARMHPKVSTDAAARLNAAHHLTGLDILSPHIQPVAPRWSG